MKRYYFILGITLLLLFLSGRAEASVDDSIGLTLRNGKVVIIHEVGAGEGLMMLGRRYKVNWTDIRDYNPGVVEKIFAGQKLYIPTNKTEKEFFGDAAPVYSTTGSTYKKPVTPKNKPDKPAAPAVSPGASKTTFTMYYVVKKGETLFTIAARFKTTADFLMQLNGMKTHDVKEGMDLLVPLTDETTADTAVYRPPSKNTTPPAKPKVTGQKDSIKQAVTQGRKTTEGDSVNRSRDKKERRDTKKQVTVPAPSKDTVAKTVTPPAPVHKPDTIQPVTGDGYEINVENVPEYEVEKVTEKGWGMVRSDEKFQNGKDFILHHNAPVNSVVYLVNPANNRSVYVRVAGNFQRKSADDPIVYINAATAAYLQIGQKEKTVISLSFAR